MISIKTEREINLMRIAGKIVGDTHNYLKKFIRPGITTEELDKLAYDYIVSCDAVPSFKGYDGYPGSICTSVNEEVVHGIPGKYRLKEGDIISYISQNTENYGQTVTHKIRSRTVDANGEPGFITYGTTTDTNDETIVTYPFVLGKYKTHIPKIGTFFQFLKTPQGYIVCILIPFMLLIIYQGLNCIRLFRRYKKEQTEALQEERDQIEAERLENKKMLEELQALKAQLEKQNNATDVVSETVSEETGEGDEA